MQASSPEGESRLDTKDVKEQMEEDVGIEPTGPIISEPYGLANRCIASLPIFQTTNQLLIFTKLVLSLNMEVRAGFEPARPSISWACFLSKEVQ